MPCRAPVPVPDPVRAASSHGPGAGVLVLGWFKDATKLRILALDPASRSPTAYRYLHEAMT